MRDADAVVIGAGFGGLGAALTLAEAGAKVTVYEALTYPGGCASTFSRRGYRFEAGATLSAGLEVDQPIRRWLRRHGVEPTIDLLDPSLELRAPDLRIVAHRDRDRFVDAFCALPDVPAARLRRFFEEQGRIAAMLWSLFDDPDLLPPLSTKALVSHLRRGPESLRVMRWMGRSLSAMVRHFGLSDCAPLTTWLDAICQITVQCDHHTAEAPFAIAAIDYFFHGAGHIRGGLGSLAAAFVRAIESAGGEVRLADRVRSLCRGGGGYTIQTRKDAVRAPLVLANVLPQALSNLLDQDLPALRARGARVREGWSACMLYLGLDLDCPLPPHAHHIEIVQRPGFRLDAGNHLLVSLADARDTDRAPPGQRVATVSTHVDPKALEAGDAGGIIDAIHQTMREGLRTHLPELDGHIKTEMTASPRTFQRFTRRPQGLVGGIPRRVGLRQYLDLLPKPVLPGLYLVGDSVMLGQSVLGTTLGGHRTAIAAQGA
ncbi:MAG: FAD-dependent oxidoreductase [Deltaproteobacteria bacterium]|nr:MAG: FAD-dependent oxidoreductase [Deltaproteobacteria bacterium]